MGNGEEEGAKKKIYEMKVLTTPSTIGLLTTGPHGTFEPVSYVRVFQIRKDRIQVSLRRRNHLQLASQEVRRHPPHIDVLRRRDHTESRQVCPQLVCMWIGDNHGRFA